MSRRDRRPQVRRAALDRLEPRRLLALAVSGVELTTDVDPRDGIEVTFNADVDHGSITNADVRVENLTIGGGALAELAPTGPAGDRARLTFADAEYVDPANPVRLPDGYYELSLAADGITDVAGDPLKADAAGSDFAGGRYTSGDRLWFLSADFNRDRTVNLADYGIQRAGMGTGTTFAQGDANGDGVVNLADFGLVRGNFGRTLEAPPTQAGEVLATLSTSSTVELSWVLPSDSLARPDAWHLFRGEGDGIGFDPTPVAILSNTDADPANDFLETLGSDGVLRGHVTDAGLLDGTLYRYDLRAWSATAGLSPSTDAAAEWTQLVPPDNLTAGFLDDGSVLLEWTLDGSRASHNVIEYRTSPAGPWLPAAEVHGQQSHWIVDGLLNDQGAVATPSQVADYEFQVKSDLRDDAGAVLRDTAPTDAVEAELVAPTNVAAVGADPHQSDEIDVTWTRGGNEQTQHRLQVSNDGGTTWTAPPSGDIAWAFGEDQNLGGLADDQNYAVGVRGELVVYADEQDQVGTLVETSDWTIIPGVEIPALAPRDVNAIAVGDGTIRVEWSDVSVAETGYTVDRRETTGQMWAPVGTTGAGATSFVDNTPAVDTEYVYRVTTDAPLTAPGIANSQDPNDVNANEADGDNVGIGGWSGDEIGDYEATATARELNGPHSYLSVDAEAGGAGTWYRVIDRNHVGANPQQVINDAVAEAEEYVGLWAEGTVEVNGKVIWTTRHEWGDVLTTTSADGRFTEIVHEIISTTDGSLIAPFTGDRATVTAKATGTLLELTDDEKSRFLVGHGARVGSISPFTPTVSIAVVDADGQGTSNSRSVSEDGEPTVEFVVTRTGPTTEPLTVSLRQLDGTEGMSDEGLTKREKADQDKTKARLKGSPASPSDFSTSWKNSVTFEAGRRGDHDVAEVHFKVVLDDDTVRDGYKDPRTKWWQVEPGAAVYEDGMEHLRLAIAGPNQIVTSPDPVVLNIADDAQPYYTDWSTDLVPSNKVRASGSLARDTTTWTSLLGTEWKEETAVGFVESWEALSSDGSEQWLNHVDLDNVDDNDVDFEAGISFTSSESDTWNVGGGVGPISLDLYSWTKTKGSGWDKSDTFPGGADNNEQVYVTALLSERLIWGERWRYYKDDAGNWIRDVDSSAGNVLFRRGISEDPQFARGVQRVAREWLDSDDRTTDDLHTAVPERPGLFAD